MPKDLFTAEWFPYYFDRFNGSGRVAMLSLEEEGAYHRAIRFAWEFGSVPSDPEMLAAIIQKQCTAAVAEKILRLFEPMPGVPSQCIHPTVEEIREEQYRKYVSARERGEKGAEKRWGKKDVPSSATGAVGVPPTKDDGEPPASRSSQNSSAIAELKQDRDKRGKTKDPDPESFSWTDSVAGVRACEAYAAVDPRLVEIAVIKTLITHRNSPNAKPIKNLPAYCREEIEDMQLQAKKLGSSTIDAMLFSYRQKAEKYLTKTEIQTG